LNLSHQGMVRISRISYRSASQQATALAARSRERREFSLWNGYL
jgi:hypothetical protein